MVIKRKTLRDAAGNVISDHRLAAPVPSVAASSSPPSFLTKLAHAKAALTRWNAAGRPMASRKVRAERLAICQACDHYNPTGNWLLGECRHPGCGCTRLKLMLASERCPIGKWEASPGA